MFLSRLNGKAGKIFITNDATEVAKNLQRMADGEDLRLEYWKIKNSASVSLSPVSIKGGKRTTAPARELVEIEAGGKSVGSVEVDV